MSPEALSQLRLDEGYRDLPYFDTEGQMTIGVGHNLSVPLCAAAIEAQFQHDVFQAEQACKVLIPKWASLSPVRQGVLINMCFNLGPGRLLGFKKMLTALGRSKYAKAASEMLDSKWAEQLPDRANRLANLMITGKAQRYESR